MNHIANNVRSARLKAGLTQAQLAELTSISRNYIVQIESGRRKPAIKTLDALSKATDTSISELLNGDEFIERLKAEMLDRAKSLNIEMGKLLKNSRPR
jgi:transcriptional regulator with XRE-family HTH domain